jgi:ABC-type transport system involved in multi-copper enzyme maturation permease subunit
MRRILAIVWLTWKAALRLRLIWVMAGLLGCSVFFLPMLLKDDGTARGMIQILLAYNLTIITAFLGFATLWISCGTMSRDVEECQMQMVVTKPIYRWQVWLGKWLGVMLVNAILLGLSGLSVYGLLMHRAAGLSPSEKDVLRKEVFVSRAGLKEPPADHSADIEKTVRDLLKKNAATALDARLLRQQVVERFKAMEEVVPPGYMRPWVIDLGVRKEFLRDTPLYIRTKFMAAETNVSGSYQTEWRVGVPGSKDEKYHAARMPSDSFQEFEIPPNLWDNEGKLRIYLVNRDRTPLIFSEEEGLEVLYQEAPFAVNYARGLGVVLCWLALLAAIGMAAASFLSFPVAVFFSLTMLLAGFSSGSMEEVLQRGSALGLINPNTGVTDNQTIFDMVMLPVFRGLLAVVKLAESFSPVDSLSSGRSITWLELGRAFGEVVLVLGGFIGGVGVLLFTRRELATAQGVS